MRGEKLTLEERLERAAEDSRRDLDGDPLQLAVDTYVCNALVLLGLMLLDHAKGRRRNKELYHCTRMTLGQYSAGERTTGRMK